MGTLDDPHVHLVEISPGCYRVWHQAMVNISPVDIIYVQDCLMAMDILRVQRVPVNACCQKYHVFCADTRPRGHFDREISNSHARVIGQVQDIVLVSGNPDPTFRCRQSAGLF